MGTTFQKLLDEFHRVRFTRYRSDPERMTAVIEAMEITLQAMLEKLRDQLDQR